MGLGPASKNKLLMQFLRPLLAKERVLKLHYRAFKRNSLRVKRSMRSRDKLPAPPKQHQEKQVYLRQMWTDLRRLFCVLCIFVSTTEGDTRATSRFRISLSGKDKPLISHHIGQICLLQFLSVLLHFCCVLQCSFTAYWGIPHTQNMCSCSCMVSILMAQPQPTFSVPISVRFDRMCFKQVLPCVV